MIKKRVIVTGCSRGIGLATVKLLSEKNEFDIIGTSTKEGSINQTANLECFQLNLADSNSISSFISKIKDFKFDFLVNNAGILLEDWSNSEINLEQLRNTFEVNLFGTIELTEKLLPHFNDNGHIINVTSGWGSLNFPEFDEYQPHYKMSKAALNMYTKLLASRLTKQRIMVSAIDPGWTKTDMGGANAERVPLDAAQDIYKLLNENFRTGEFWYDSEVREW